MGNLLLDSLIHFTKTVNEELDKAMEVQGDE